MQKKKLRILYIFNGYTLGGAEKLVCDLALSMSETEAFVGTFGIYAYKDEMEQRIINKLQAGGVTAGVLSRHMKKDFFFSLLEICRFAKEHRVDVIHGHCSIPMLFAKLAGFLLGIPVLCTIHSITGYSVLREWLTSWMASGYVAISDSAKTYMKNALKIPEKKIVSIHNAVPAERFLTAKKTMDFWIPYGGKKDEVVLLNVARVCEVKNQICILKALKRCMAYGDNNFHVYILGAYHEQDSVYLELLSYIQENGLTEKVTFLGMYQNVEDFLVNANCFLLTSRYEGLSLAFLEAVLTRVPVISTDIPFVHELNAISPCAAVIPQDADEELAQLLCKKKYSLPSEETVRIFSEKFTMESFTKDHGVLYRSVRKEIQ